MALDSSLQADASWKCALNACSEGQGFGHAPCKQPLKHNVCPCALNSHLGGCFVASWESPISEQHSWNPVYGQLHMSVRESACRPASHCNLVITLEFGAHHRTKCSNYYPVVGVKFSKGDKSCFDKFHTCFHKHGHEEWHVVIVPTHSPKDRHWKWMR